MALYKEIRQDDGVMTCYHRILFLQLLTNHHNSIAVVSYVDDTARDGEKSATLMQPYQKSVTYELPYDKSMTIESAYEYLKSLPQFEGATNV